MPETDQGCYPIHLLRIRPKKSYTRPTSKVSKASATAVIASAVPGTSSRERTAARRVAWQGPALTQPAWDQQPTERRGCAHTGDAGLRLGRTVLVVLITAAIFRSQIMHKAKGTVHTLPLQHYWNIVLIMCFSCPCTGHKGMRWPPGTACHERSHTWCSAHLYCLFVRILGLKHPASSAQVPLAPSRSILACIDEWFITEWRATG